MFPFSVRKVREKAYEVFLLMHIALALPTLVLLFCHVAIFEGSYDGWLWACVAVWVSIVEITLTAVLRPSPPCG
jgi:hypothetical protein